MWRATRPALALTAALRSVTLSGARMPTRALSAGRCLARADGGADQPQAQQVGDEVVIRPYRPPRKPENDDQLRARLVYQARKRGIKENDLIFSTFCHKYLDQLSRPQMEQLDIILNEHDNEWDMFNWLSGTRPAPEYLKELELFGALVDHTQNRSKEVRVTMPPLKPPSDKA
ncbi:uncharacterized protein MONBRDRAFT_35418 [Monosiga brevicollis MX1]|uniref:Succinate dehydrogenase assembly factor 2, mitochondrial n=1 Tax=Monosiga brevicollis TaxID=81824 RepID=A9UNV8_MONBE|nr:uncharacterized protein MONBRDRAFT_35418 [Monosiga brevicollis MX1]EDQ92312.1 predicted protein [Monosiga brevicollis MX1]|eukprot:XP_001742074.1 hypothetical protein [Monosiga brevicollis MX1]